MTLSAAFRAAESVFLCHDSTALRSAGNAPAIILRRTEQPETGNEYLCKTQRRMNIYTSSTSRESNICVQRLLRPRTAHSQRLYATRCQSAQYAFPSFHPYLTALRKSPFRHSIKPISAHDKAHIGMQKSLFRKPIKPISQSEAQKSDLLTEIFRPAKMRKSLFRLRINICSLLFYENILSKKSQAGNVYLCSSRHFQATLTRAHQKLRRQFAVVPTNLYICIIMTT